MENCVDRQHRIKRAESVKEMWRKGEFEYICSCGNIFDSKIPFFEEHCPACEFEDIDLFVKCTL